MDHIRTQCQSVTKNPIPGYWFGLPKRLSRPNSKYVAVFIERSTKKQLVIPITPGKYLQTSHYDPLIDKAWSAYIQERSPSGARTEVSMRGGLGWVDYLNNLTEDEALLPLSSIPDRRRQLLVKAVEMACCFHPPKLLEKLRRCDLSAPANHAEEQLFYQYLVEVAEEYAENPILEAFKSNSTNASPKANQEHSSVELDRDWPTYTKDSFSKRWSAKPGRIRIQTQAEPIDMELAIETNAPLVVMLHGRKGPHVRLPYLVGKSVLSGLNVSRLSISDPALYRSDSLSLGWYAGTSSIPDLQEFLAEAVHTIAESISATRVVFVGGSGGGFASLVLTSKLDNSRALVWNPQTDIFRYYRKYAEEFCQLCWNGDFHALKHNAVTSLPLTAGRDGLRGEVLYMQESTDSHHVLEHWEPLYEAIRANSDFYAFVSHWGEGHVPPPKHMLKEALSVATADNLDEHALAFGFKRI